MGLVIVLIALYAFVVGPVDYWLVRRLGSPRLTFLTFPLMVLGFTLAAWFGAKAWIGGELSVTAVQRTLYVPDEGVALQFHLASVFVPMVGDYEVGQAGGAPVYPVRTFASSSFSSSAPSLDANSGVLTQRIPGWQERVVYANDTIPNGDDGIRLKVEAGGHAVRVENRTGYPLPFARLVFGNDIWEIAGGIPQGDTVVPMEKPNKKADLSWPVDFWSFTELPRNLKDMGRSADLREFHVRDALSRGALMLVAGDTEPQPSGFTIDGEQRPERGPCRFIAVTYPAQERQTVAFGTLDADEES